MSKEQEPAVAVGEVLSAKLSQHRLFMQILLMQLTEDGFDVRSFVEKLYVWQESMPAPMPDDDDHMRRMSEAGMKEWEILTEMAEGVIRLQEPG